MASGINVVRKSDQGVFDRGPVSDRTREASDFKGGSDRQRSIAKGAKPLAGLGMLNPIISQLAAIRLSGSRCTIIRI